MHKGYPDAKPLDRTNVVYKIGDFSKLKDPNPLRQAEKMKAVAKQTEFVKVLGEITHI